MKFAVVFDEEGYELNSKAFKNPLKDNVSESLDYDMNPFEDMWLEQSCLEPVEDLNIILPNGLTKRIKKGFITNDYLVQRSLDYLTIELTKNCNARCKDLCLAQSSNKEEGESNLTQLAEKLGEKFYWNVESKFYKRPEDFHHLYGNMHINSFTTNKPIMCISGGEPLMYKYWKEFVEAFMSKRKSLSDCVLNGKVVFATNGSKLCDDNMKFFEKYNESMEIQLSYNLPLEEDFKNLGLSFLNSKLNPETALLGTIHHVMEKSHELGIATTIRMTGTTDELNQLKNRLNTFITSKGLFSLYTSPEPKEDIYDKKAPNTYLPTETIRKNIVKNKRFAYSMAQTTPIGRGRSIVFPNNTLIYDQDNKHKQIFYPQIKTILKSPLTKEFYISSTFNTDKNMKSHMAQPFNYAYAGLVI